MKFINKLFWKTTEFWTGEEDGAYGNIVLLKEINLSQKENTLMGGASAAVVPPPPLPTTSSSHHLIYTYN
jgi:hypothetical protein